MQTRATIELVSAHWRTLPLSADPARRKFTYQLAEREGFEPSNTFWDVTHFPGERLRPLGHLSARPQGYRSLLRRSNLAASRFSRGSRLVARRNIQARVLRPRRRRHDSYRGDHQGALGIRRVHPGRHFQRGCRNRVLILLRGMTVGVQLAE